MTNIIDAQQSGVIDALRDVAKNRASATVTAGAASAVPASGSGTEGSVQDRTALDSVTLSQSGQKIVNLNRGAELAKDIIDTPIDENFADSLKKATDDLFRIHKSFNQTIRSLFNWWK